MSMFPWKPEKRPVSFKVRFTSSCESSSVGMEIWSSGKAGCVIKCRQRGEQTRREAEEERGVGRVLKMGVRN